VVTVKRVYGQRTIWAEKAHRIKSVSQPPETTHLEKDMQEIKSMMEDLTEKTDKLASGVAKNHILETFDLCSEVQRGSALSGLNLDVGSPAKTKRQRSDASRKAKAKAKKEAQIKQARLVSSYDLQAQSLSSENQSKPSKIVQATLDGRVSKEELRVAAVRAVAASLGPLPATRACVNLPSFAKVEIHGLHYLVNVQPDEKTFIRRLYELFRKSRPGDLVGCSWCKCVECKNFPTEYKTIVNFRLWSLISVYHTKRTKVMPPDVESSKSDYSDLLARGYTFVNLQRLYHQKPSYCLGVQNKICRLARLQRNKMKAEEKARAKAYEDEERRGERGRGRHAYDYEEY
jgi:uncharacterized protein YoxC